MVPTRGKRQCRERGTRRTRTHRARAHTHPHAHRHTPYSDASSRSFRASTAGRRGRRRKQERRVLTDTWHSLDGDGMCVHAWFSCANHITTVAASHTTKYPFVTPHPLRGLSSLQSLLPPRSVGTPGPPPGGVVLLRYQQYCTVPYVFSLPYLRYLTLHALIASPRDGGMQSERERGAPRTEPSLRIRALYAERSCIV